MYASGPDFQAIMADANRALSEMLDRQRIEQTRILMNVPLTIQQAAADQIAELKRGFRETVDALLNVQGEVRRLQATLA